MVSFFYFPSVREISTYRTIHNDPPWLRASFSSAWSNVECGNNKLFLWSRKYLLYQHWKFLPFSTLMPMYEIVHHCPVIRPTHLILLDIKKRQTGISQDSSLAPSNLFETSQVRIKHHIVKLIQMSWPIVVSLLFFFFYQSLI